MGKGCLNVFLGLLLILIVVAGGAMATPWGQCELTYWTGFHANPTVRSAADLATYYPNARAQEAEQFVYSQCATEAAAREYQRLFPAGRYTEKVKKLLEGPPVAAPPPALPSKLLTALKAQDKREISLLCNVYDKDGQCRTSDVSLIEQQARKAVEDWLTANGYTSRVVAAGESADLTLELGVTYSGSFGNSGPFPNLPSPGKGVPGYDTTGTLQLQGGSWKATFLTICPEDVKYSYKTTRLNGPAYLGPKVAPPPAADTVVKINAEHVYKKITSCMNAAEVREDSAKRIQDALARLKQLESGGASAILVQQAREELEAAHAPPADIARALIMEAKLRGEQRQWHGAIELTKKALALSPSPALRAQLASYRSKVWTEVKASDLHEVDPVTFRFPVAQKVQGAESNYFGMIWPQAGELLYPVTDLKVTSRTDNGLEVDYNGGEIRFSFDDPDGRRVKTGTFAGGQEGRGLSLSREGTVENVQRWRVRILELEVDPRIWEFGYEKYQYRVDRLAVDFVYKERGSQCTYGQIRYRSHYR